MIHMLVFIQSEYVCYSCAVMMNVDLVGICFDAVCGYYVNHVNYVQ